MNLMISEITSQYGLERLPANSSVEAIAHAIGECALGQVLIARSAKGVCAILIGANRGELEVDLASRFPKSMLVANEAVVHDDLTKVIRFVEKPAEGLYLPLDIRGTPFQRRVWEKLRAIPVGRTVTYTDVAYWVGPLTSPRAVAGACASNPIALAIPCHRVVRSNGDLACYQWGVERKREMIEREATVMSARSGIISPASGGSSSEARIAAYDWQALAGELDNYGCAVLPKLLSPEECRTVAAIYPDESYFRSHINMARHGFGKGEYRYFKYPLPDILDGLRTALYPGLARAANEWNGRMGINERYPDDHASFLKRCHDAGQTRPTPLLLQYVAGDFNCLHQDLYGDLAFPIQVAILLSEPGKDFTGGEFVLTEQRPRMQSRAEVVPLRQGDAVAFAVHNRPVQGSKGNYRVNLRHGVSRVRSGTRHTVGIIFHDAT
jgi:O-6-methylguanine DNA methyltransferase